MKRFLSVFLPVIVTAALLCSCGEARVRRLATRMMKSEITVPQTLELMNGKYIADSLWLESDGKVVLIGDPTTDYNMMKLYRQVLAERTGKGADK